MSSDDLTANLVPVTDLGRKATKVSIGDTYQLWTIVGGPLARRDASGKRILYYPCRCRCGVERPIMVSNLRAGYAKSCGCLRKEERPKMQTHRCLPRGLYKAWDAMRYRCNTETCKGYRNWGGRGITVCPEWESSYEAFRDWSLANGWKPGLSIERIGNELGYSPDNCRWIPRGDQNLNKRNNVRVTAFGETKVVSEWVRDPRCTVTHGAILTRLKKGWDAEFAIAAPKQVRMSAEDIARDVRRNPVA